MVFAPCCRVPAAQSRSFDTLPMYTTIKQLHVALVAASGLGFALRGVLALRSSPSLQAPWLRIAPHVVDSALLASAIALVVIGAYDVLRAPWLLTKIALLVIYIVLGMVALKRGRTPQVRGAAFAAALVVFAAIVATAITKRPFGLFD
jgi:uncharacterized membrane protein SirB2